MRNAKGFSLIMIFLLLFQIAHSGGGFMAAAEGGQGIYQDPAKLKVEGKSKDENSITWQVVINEAKQATEELSTIITFNNGQTHRSIDKSVNAKIEQTDQGYEITTPTSQETHTITLTTEITNDEQTNFNLSAKTEFEEETIIAEETVEVVKEETPEVEEPAEESAKNEKPEKDTKTEEKGKEEKSGDEEKQPKKEEKKQLDDGVKQEQTYEEDNEELDEEVGVPHPPFATTARPFAIPGVMSGDEWPEPGSLKLDKKATEKGFAEWEVELTVEGKNLKTSSDIVLVFDRSNSMYASRLTKAKAAAKQFVDNLLIDEDSTVRIALVPFGTSADPHTDFQGFSGKQHLKDKIDAIRVTGGNDGGTNIQAGLRSAQSLLANSNADQKTIVLLSDGAPTYSFRANNASSYSWPNNKYDFILSNFTNRRIGNGSAYNLPSGFLGIGGDRYTVNGYRVTTNGIATISEAKNIINSGTDIYSVGLEVGNDANATYVLENSQNKGYYAGGDDDMTPIFNEIAASIGYAATQAKVTDPLGDMFDLVKDGSYSGENFSASHGTVAWDETAETFTWNIGSVKEGEEYTLKYKVALDCTKNPEAGVEYPTNKDTPLNYKDHNGNDATKHFPIPKVSVDSGKITAIGYRVNADKQPIDSNGNVVGSPAEAERFYKEVFGDDLTLNESYNVPAGNTPDGYQLHVGEDPTKITLKSICTTVAFGYVKTSELPAGKVIAKYVDEDGKEVAPSEEHTGHIGEQYTTEQKNIPGYQFIEVDPNGAPASGEFTSEEQTVIYVYDQLKGSIKVIKVDEADDTIKLKGAKFTIKDADGDQVDELVTDSTGEAISEELPIGEYTLEEVKAPYGYELSENQNLTVTITANKVTEITVKNKQLKGSIKIIKVDAADNSILLDGAEFALKDADGNTVASGLTNNQGEYVFENVVVGNYQLVETKAPAEYRLLQKSIDVEVTPNNLEITETIENSKQDWKIPKTGGIGTLGFYGVGLILMGVALWFVLRRRYI